MGTEAAPLIQDPTPHTSTPPQPLKSDDEPPLRDLPSILRLATDRTLVFLSNASNETLGACLLGLSATTYVLLGRLGLVIIGAVGGVVLHATWENSASTSRHNGSKAAEARRRREVGVDVVSRVLEWRESVREKDRDRLNSEDGESASTATDPYGAFQPETAAALNALSDAVVKDYIRWWYTPLLPAENGFPNSCRRIWNNFALSMSSHLSRKRPIDTFLDFATNSSSIVIVFFNEISNALSASPSSQPPDAIKVYLNLKPTSNLANIIDRKHQEKKLLMVADDILENFLDVNMYRCAPVRIFLREVLAHLVLEQSISLCSEAEWINQWVIYLLEDGEPELIDALDQGISSQTPSGLVNMVKHRNRPESSDSPAAGDQKPQPTPNHKRRVSRAEEAMDEAMREAQRLTKLILEEEAQRSQGTARPTPIAEGNVLEHVEESKPSHMNGMDSPKSSLQNTLQGDQRASQPTKQMGEGSGLEPVISNGEQLSNPSTFTNFDQIQPLRVPTALLEPELPGLKIVPQLTLVDAKIIIFDEGAEAEKRILKTKPQDDYLIQVEPASSVFPGWMIPRKYSDFENLHEVIRRISVVSGVNFPRANYNLPLWKNVTAGRLRLELEAYLVDALKYEVLAESEGMRRFLDKDRGLTRSPNKGGFWPNPAALETVGKGVLSVLTKAPNQVAGGVLGGSKAVIGGVTNVFTGGSSSTSGAELQRQQSYPTSGSRKANGSVNGLGGSTPASPETADGPDKRSYPTSGSRKNQSTITLMTPVSPGQDGSRRQSPSPGPSSRLPSPLERRQSIASSINDSDHMAPKHPSRSSMYGDNVIAQRGGLNVSSVEHSRSTTPELTNLPPPPEDMPDDYTSPTRSSKQQPPNLPSRPQTAAAAIAQTQMSVDGTSFFDVPTTSSPSSPARSIVDSISSPEPPRRPSTTTLKTSSESARRSPLRRSASVKRETARPPMSEQEAQVTIELFFAVINELYTLSSAWNIRRTLLGAAKTFLLRPGNPQLESIRLMLQETIVDANTSDAGIAGHIRKLRANAMPTDAERKEWPAPPSDEERERTRVKARKLLVERGMPQALTSVMGMAASGEALGKVFDCLQISELARGLMFGIFLQAMRAVTQ